MSTPHHATALDADVHGAPVLVPPTTRRLDGAVREASVPPFAQPVRHGSLADLPFENAAVAPGDVVLSRKTGTAPGGTSRRSGSPPRSWPPRRDSSPRA